jgi:hypothetical protein
MGPILYWKFYFREGDWSLKEPDFEEDFPEFEASPEFELCPDIDTASWDSSQTQGTIS